MDVYSAYKPLRNFLRKADTFSSLATIWRLNNHLITDTALPVDFIRDLPWADRRIKGRIHPWILSILAREIVINGSVSEGCNLTRWFDLATAINLIYKISNYISSYTSKLDVLHELHRIVHQQFPWNKDHGYALSRYLCIYGEEDLNSLVVERTSLDISKIYTLGFAFSGAFLERPYYMAYQDFSCFGIPEDNRNNFLDELIIDLDTLRERYISCQEYNENWFYSPNCLLATPLISLGKSRPGWVICPIQSYLMSRISEGIYYDIVSHKSFSNNYGNSFERYVERISKLFLKEDKVYKPKVYKFQKQDRHGPDLILKDETALIVVECKAKQVKAKFRYDHDKSSLYESLDFISKFIVQNYKNIMDMKNGYTEWNSDGLDLFSVIVTLNDWILFVPTVHKLLEEKVKAGLAEENLPFSLLKEIPYFVVSIDDYEVIIQILKKVSIKQLLQKKMTEDYKSCLANELDKLKLGLITSI